MWANNLYCGMAVGQVCAVIKGDLMALICFCGYNLVLVSWFFPGLGEWHLYHPSSTVDGSLNLLND